MTMYVWRRISEGIDEVGRVALVTIVSTRGSAPREAGARMIVRPDGSFSGTIGGGALEYQIIATARASLASELPRWSLRDYTLGPGLGQCCGGQVTVLIEFFGESDLKHVKHYEMVELFFGFRSEALLKDSAHLPRCIKKSVVPPNSLAILRQGDTIIENFYNPGTNLLLFGAGHVGRALVIALAALPFRIRWIDPRADAFPALLPANVETVVTDTPVAEIHAAFPDSFVVVMTHSHALDLAIISAALKRGSFGYVGLIGSATKRARFVNQMRAAAISDAQIASLICPIGVPGIHGKDPAVIAASVTAHLLQTREHHATIASESLVTRGGKRLMLVGRDNAFWHVNGDNNE